MNYPQPGDIFCGRYEVEAVIGAGGFAEVYRAIDTATGQAVALKVLRPTDSSSYAPDVRARFEREVQILARLSHPRIIEQRGFGESPDGLLYVVFELLGGTDLSELLRGGGRLSPAQTTGVLRQTLEALEVAHTAGLLHRDLKPQNIRVVEQNEQDLDIKLLDWGIARGTDDGHPSITATGDLIGTPRYMSPEQLRGTKLDHRSDIYSLGLVAFELLMGREALGGNTIFDQIERMESGFVLSAPELERIGIDLLAVIQRMTARDPAKRFQSAREVLDALGPGASAPRRLPLVLVGAVVIALIVVVALVTQLQETPSNQSKAAETTGASRLRNDRSNPLGQAGSDSVENLEQVSKDAPSPPRNRKRSGKARTDRASSGCGEARPFEGVGKFNAELMAVLPRDYTPDRMFPVMVLLHEERRDPTQLLGVEEFLDLADEEGVILLAPRGHRVKYSDGISVGTPWRWGEGDRGGEVDRNYLLGHLDDAERQLCIDRSRVFVVAQGNAAPAALALSCTDRVAAIAINSFGFRIPSPGGRAGEIRSRWCDHPTAALWIVPDGSGVLPIDETRACDGRFYLGLDRVEAHWMTRNDCSGDGHTVPTPPGGACREWDGAAPFMSCTLHGGYGWPHRPPAATGRLVDCGMETPPSFPIESWIWQFFTSAQ